MDINFDALFSVSDNNTENSQELNTADTAEEASYSLIQKGLRDLGIELPLCEEKPLETASEPPNAFYKLQREADYNQSVLERSAEAYSHYQENIKASSRLITEILKGLKEAEDIHSLFLKAVEALSCMTDNSVIYEQAEADLKAIYGRGLQEKPPLQFELAEASERLKKLEAAYSTEPDKVVKERLQTAIKSHKEKVSYLQELIRGSKVH